MDFTNAYAQGFARVAARVLPIHLAQPAKNAAAIIEDATSLSAQRVALIAYPELCVTGYSCDDLFLQEALLDAAEDAVVSIVKASEKLFPMIIVGAPLRQGTRLYNCAVVIYQGAILGVVPKTYLPSYREFYEDRWFTPGVPDDVSMGTIRVGDYEAYLRANTAYEVEAVKGMFVYVEICEDMWVPIPPSASGVLAGAPIVVNISGSPITIGKADERKLLARASSARGNAAYVFTTAGSGESSTDLSWDGQTFVYECGDLLGESERFPTEPAGTIVDIDLVRLRQDRLRQGIFEENRRAVEQSQKQFHGARLLSWAKYKRDIKRLPTGDIGLLRKIDRFPFVPDDPERLAQDCYEAYNIQVYGLVQRIKAIGNPKPVIGVSGGLDSTHALIVCAKAMDLLGRPRSDILAFTMPGFATSDTTKNSALELMEAMGVTAETLDIRPAATQLLKDIGHPFADGEPLYDVTFENVQAGLRTDYLFRIANQRGGLVVGTGDLSELALGWCTFGVGDHMSHYGVNAGVPKTLIQYLIHWAITENLIGEETSAVLERILAQEISPELVPPADGKTMQSTESIIGPYALHDFFLYHFLRGERPSRIAYLAWVAWRDKKTDEWPLASAEGRLVSYDLATIRGWLEFFLRRFFAHQFKRSTIPNGPMVSAGGSLSPRSGWRMPSDASPDTWLEDLVSVPEEV